MKLKTTKMNSEKLSSLSDSNPIRLNIVFMLVKEIVGSYDLRKVVISSWEMTPSPLQSISLKTFKSCLFSYFRSEKLII